MGANPCGGSVHANGHVVGAVARKEAVSGSLHRALVTGTVAFGVGLFTIGPQAVTA